MGLAATALERACTQALPVLGDTPVGEGCFTAASVLPRGGPSDIPAFCRLGCCEVSSIFYLLLSSIKFTTKLKGMCKIFPSTYPLPQQCVASLIINVTEQNGAPVTKDEPTRTRHNHPKSLVCIRVHSWCCTFRHLDTM